MGGYSHIGFATNGGLCAMLKMVKKKIQSGDDSISVEESVRIIDEAIGRLASNKQSSFSDEQFNVNI